MNAGSLSLLLFAAFLVFIVAATVRVFRSLHREFLGRQGRAYTNVVADLYRQTERRGRLIEDWARSRETRIVRVEKR